MSHSASCRRFAFFLALVAMEAYVAGFLRKYDWDVKPRDIWERGWREAALYRALTDGIGALVGVLEPEGPVR